MQGLLRLGVTEKAHYDELFQQADINKDGYIGSDDSAFFLRSGVEKKVLSEIWSLADQEKRGRLTRDGFYLALRLLSAAKEGKPISLEAAIAAPEWKQESLSTDKQGTRPTAVSEEWSISAQEKSKFLEIFEKADEDKDGFVTGPQARQLFGRSGLELADLGKIWTLSDIDKDHQLDAEEFVIAMYFINSRLKGRSLPDHLPLSLQRGRATMFQQPSVPQPAAPQPVAPQPSQTPQRSAVVEESYIISSEERGRYEDIFRKADENYTGFVTGQQARQLFGRSGLSMTDLAKIWALSDADQDTQLNKEEFVLAMYLINSRLKGKELPSSLPPSLKPSTITGGPSLPLTPPTSSGFSSISLVPLVGSSSPSSSAFFTLGSSGKSTGMSSPLSGSLSALPPSLSTVTDTALDVQSAKEQASLLEEIGKTRMSIEEIKGQAAQQQRQKERHAHKLRKLRAKDERLQREYHGEESLLAQLTADVKKLELDVETEQAQIVATNGKREFTAEKLKAVREQKERLERIKVEKVGQHKEEEQLLAMVQAQLEGSEAEVRKQKEQLELLDQQIQSLQRKRQDIKDRTIRAQSQLAEEKAKAVQLQEESYKLEKELVPMVSELSLAEAAVAQVQLRAKPTSKPPVASNPFGQEHAFFPAFPESSPSQFGSSADKFFEAAQLFPAAPEAPVPGQELEPTSQGTFEGNFFDVAGAGDLDVTETKEAFGHVSVNSPFGTTFDFASTPSPQQQSFGVVEVQGGTAQFFSDQGSLF